MAGSSGGSEASGVLGVLGFLIKAQRPLESSGLGRFFRYLWMGLKVRIWINNKEMWR